MVKTKVKKEKVIKEFREELKLKQVEDREVFDEPFFKILNQVYKHEPENIKPNITRFGTLSFIVKKNHTYIYLEWSPKRIPSTLLSITIMSDEFDDGGIYTLTLDEALKKIDGLWIMKD